jgi:hypothetical protein
MKLPKQRRQQQASYDSKHIFGFPNLISKPLEKLANQNTIPLQGLHRSLPS